MNDCLYLVSFETVFSFSFRCGLFLAVMVRSMNPSMTKLLANEVEEQEKQQECLDNELKSWENSQMTLILEEKH